MKKQEKVKKIIPILVCVLVAIAIIAYIVFVIFNKSDYRLEYNDMKVETLKEMEKEMYMPSGVFQLKQNYEGKQELKSFYKNLKDFYEEVIVISKLKDNKIESYYDKNPATVKNATGITNLEDFKKFAEYTKKHGKLKEFNSAQIDTDSIKNTLSALEFKITLIFDDGKELEYKVRFMNNKSSTVAKYSVVE